MSLSAIGIFHTVLGLAAIFTVIFIIFRNKQIGVSGKANRFYLLATVLTAASALGIFNHGSFNVAHGLAILTILAVVAGIVAAKMHFLGWLQKYIVALCLTSTILFHLLPTTTEILLRFPLDAPTITSLQDPLLLNTFKVIFISWLLFLLWQMNWLRKNA